MMIDNISQLNSMTSLQIDPQIQGYLIILTKKNVKAVQETFFPRCSSVCTALHILLQATANWV